MAVEMLDADRRGRVVVCNAPIVEGAVMAATEASGGSPLETVRRTAEELVSAMKDPAMKDDTADRAGDRPRGTHQCGRVCMRARRSS